MLLEFRISNYKTFRRDTNFSMIASTQREYNESLIRSEKEPTRVLPVAVIFGANASGKSNLIKAIKLLKDIVLSGNLDRIGIVDSQNKEALRFLYDGNQEPFGLGVTFLKNNKIYEYDITIGIMSAGSKLYVVSEKLSVNLSFQYSRNERKVTLDKSLEDVFFNYINHEISTYHANPGRKQPISDIPADKDYDFSLGNNFIIELAKLKSEKSQDFDQYLKSISKSLLMSSYGSVDEQELLLTSNYKMLASRSTVNEIQEWFTKDLLIYSDIDKDAGFSSEYSKLKDSSSIINTLFELADFGRQNISIVSDNEEDVEKATLMSTYQIGNNKQVRLKSEDIESRGTLHLIKFIIPFIDALKYGRTLVIDELDASLHPFVLAKIIKLFMDPEINTHRSQLIFTSHSAILLDHALMRRDSIVFVERDPITLESEIYSLADFKTAGNNPVRNDESYLKNYIAGKYGALPNLNLSEAVRSILMESLKECEDTAR